MAESHSIRCEDCGQGYETSRPNTRVCAICRLVRDLAFLATKTRTCWVCDETFAPLARNETACGRCTYHVRGHGETECAYCHQTTLRVKADVAVCNVCAREPEHRRKLFLALKRKQGERREAVAA